MGLTVLLFFSSAFIGGHSLIPNVFYFVDVPATWNAARIFCRLKYTDLAFIESEADLEQLKTLKTDSYYENNWIAGSDMPDASNSSDNNLGPTNPQNQNQCSTISNKNWKVNQQNCDFPVLPYFCSRAEGKRVLVQLKLDPGQVDLSDPNVQANIEQNINENLNQQGLGDAVRIRWITQTVNEEPKSEKYSCKPGPQ